MTDTSLVDRSPKALKRRLAVIEAQLKRLDAATARNAVLYGAFFLEVRNEELWRASGYEGFYAWALGKMGYKRETTRKMMRVAENFTAEIAQRYGPDKLYAALRYLEATAREEEPGDLLAVRFRIPGPTGRFESVPFDEATVTQIEDATRLVLSSQDRGEDDEELSGRAERLEAELPDKPPGTGRRGSRVKLETGTDGRVAISISAIPLDELDAAVEAIRKHLLG